MKQITISLFDETEQKFSINYEEGGKGKNVFVKGIDPIIEHMDKWFEGIELAWKEQETTPEKKTSEKEDEEVLLDEKAESDSEHSEGKELKGSKDKEDTPSPDLDKRLSDINIEYLDDKDKEVDVEALKDITAKSEEIKKKYNNPVETNTQENKDDEKAEEEDEPIKKEDLYETTTDDPTKWEGRRKKSRVWGVGNNKVINNNRDFMFNKGPDTNEN